MATNVGDFRGRLDKAAEICAQQDVRFTELRREILSLVLAADGPAGAYDLLDRLRQTRKAAAPPTIYRALDFLRARGFIHSVSVARPPHGFRWAEYG